MFIVNINNKKKYKDVTLYVVQNNLYGATKLIISYNNLNYY
jgi:hypothetical protein